MNNIQKDADRLINCSEQILEAKATPANNYFVFSVQQANRVLLLDKVARLRKAGANLYRRGAVASFEGRTKDFQRLGIGAANCMDKAAELYKQAKSV